MKKILIKLFSLLLCLAMLCGCAGENAPAGGSESAGTPGTETNTPGSGDGTAVPDESGADSSGEPEKSPVRTLTSEELQAWTDYFNTMENNGLLRFPYAGLEEDPDQLAPYLHLIFYDIGDPEWEFTDEELALLSEAGLWLELDAFRLSREFMNGYLLDHLNIPSEDTENLLDAANIGLYLMEYDAWYIAHGDTEYNPHTMERGAVFADGTVQLTYSNTFLCVAQDNGEMEYSDATMIITLVPREDGSYYIASHEMESSAYQN